MVGRPARFFPQGGGDPLAAVVIKVWNEETGMVNLEVTDGEGNKSVETSVQPWTAQRAEDGVKCYQLF